MTYSTLPIFPLIILGVFEPLALLWAYISSLANPFGFYATQSPVPELEPTIHFLPQAQIISQLLANVYVLLAALAVVCCFSPSATTARWYLIAVAFADYGHIYAYYCGLHPRVFWDASQWNDMIWGNIGASVALNMVRWLTVLGVFGRLGGDTPVSGMEKKRA